jgi:hypothetical protein
MPVHMSIVDASHPEPFTDTPDPKRFGAVSPLDPQLFASVDASAADLLAGRTGGRYDAAEVAAALEALATAAAEHLSKACATARDVNDPAFRRFFADTSVVIGLGQFFAARLRTSLLYALFEGAGDRRLLDQALGTYDVARRAWKAIVGASQDVYAKDVTYGIAWYQRGHWADRTAALDSDRAAMERASAPNRPDTSTDRLGEWVDAVLHPPSRAASGLQHTPPRSFERGQPLTIEVKATGTAPQVQVHYRHVNQAESWRREAMSVDAGVHRAVLTADYTASPFPLQYYFECVSGSRSKPTLFPGFDETWANRPYFVLRQAP